MERKEENEEINDGHSGEEECKFVHDQRSVRMMSFAMLIYIHIYYIYITVDRFCFFVPLVFGLPLKKQRDNKKKKKQRKMIYPCEYARE